MPAVLASGPWSPGGPRPEGPGREGLELSATVLQAGRTHVCHLPLPRALPEMGQESRFQTSDRGGSSSNPGQPAALEDWTRGCFRERGW